MSLPKSAVIAVTSFHGAFYPDGRKTGAFYSEVLHPFNVFTKNGYSVTIASETGDYGFDANSVTSSFLNPEELKVYEDENSPLNVAFKSTKKASDINPKDYGIFYAAGGHGTCIDFETATGLQNIASQIHLNGGVVAAVCHGPVILAGVKDLSTGELLAKGKTVTGFTDRGEEALNLTEFLKQNNHPFVSAVVKKTGANFVEPEGPWDDFSVIDGRLISGANPASATSTAEKAIEVFSA